MKTEICMKFEINPSNRKHEPQALQEFLAQLRSLGDGVWGLVTPKEK